ncbi:MAG: hypothetical protein ABW128_06285 [Rhizorhabdus sp.]
MQARQIANAILSTVGIMALCGSAHGQAQQVRDVPVIVGGDATMDACATQGKVVGLDPKGDNFLSVRGGPGGKPFREVARLHSGQVIAICQEKGVWLSIVYAKRASQQCGVATAIARARPYRGPCPSGWVHKRYIDIIAG